MNVTPEHEGFPSTRQLRASPAGPAHRPPVRQPPGQERGDDLGDQRNRSELFEWPRSGSFRWPGAFREPSQRRRPVEQRSQPPWANCITICLTFSLPHGKPTTRVRWPLLLREWSHRPIVQRLDDRLEVRHPLRAQSSISAWLSDGSGGLRDAFGLRVIAIGVLPLPEFDRMARSETSDGSQAAQGPLVPPRQPVEPARLPTCTPLPPLNA